MTNKIKSFLFDSVQIGSIAYIALTGPIVASNSMLVFSQILALTILFVAAFQMRRTKYYRIPDVGKQNELVKDGIYRYVRNPMYLSELLFFLILVINSYSIWRLIVYLLFTINFMFKIQYEETLLTTHFPKFTEYKKTSWRLIPFIY